MINVAKNGGIALNISDYAGCSDEELISLSRNGEDGALDFLEEVKKAGKRYVFFTNNSSKSPKTYIDKLAKMGCYIKRNQIITSGDVMIQYLKEYYPEKKVYLVGTPDLEEFTRFQKASAEEDG